ncbi:MAG: hypothetical protein GY835_07250 [bacterium]|nr:hypothetical protein [bacterium]
MSANRLKALPVGLFLLALFFVCGGCSSGDSVTGGINLDVELADMVTRLGLTPEQQAEATPILEIYLMDRNVMFQDLKRSGLTVMTTIRAELATCDNDAIDRMTPILSDEQMVIFHELIIEQRDSFRDRLKGDDSSKVRDMGMDDFGGQDMNRRR